MFQSYLSEYSILEVETFRMYFAFDRAIGIRKEKVWPYASQPRLDIKFDFLFKFSFFFTCMGDPPRGARQC